MIRINENYTKLKASYLFADIAKRVNAYVAAHPQLPIIRLGIGDVTEPLPPVCLAALHAATDEMAHRATFKGYGPEQGYAFLREAVAQHDFKAHGAPIEADEIFISDGSKCDVANIQEIFAADTRLAIPDPVYPVYVDTNVMAGRTGANQDGRYAGITYLESTAANGYVPAPPAVSPSNPPAVSPSNPPAVSPSNPP
ncbi:MAG: aminotransferase class I/II-fold pyridoxal phosphate-dependent enzyme, partial [Opitutae bacterium]